MTEPKWLTEAATQLGYREGPNNNTKYGKFFGLNHEPWCAMFVSWCCVQAGTPLPVMQTGMKSGYAAVVAGVQFAKTHGLWIPSWEAKPGDAICYGWNGPASAPAEMHTGFVVSSGPKGSTGHTIEGNRADQVERQTFTVGEPVVLGCIDLNRLLLGRPKITVQAKPKVKPAPQPAHPLHPHNTGPTKAQQAQITAAHKASKALDGKPLKPGGGVRKAWRALRDRINRKLKKGRTR